jgi:hypothetical protein
MALNEACASIHPEVNICFGRAADDLQITASSMAQVLLSSLPQYMVRTVQYCCYYYSIDLYVTAVGQGAAQLRKLPDREAGARGGPPREKSIPEFRPATHGGFRFQRRHGYPALYAPHAVR